MFPHVHTLQNPVGKDQAEKFGQYNPTLLIQCTWAITWIMAPLTKMVQSVRKLLEVCMLKVFSIHKKTWWHSPSEFSSPCHFTGAVPRWQITETTEKTLVRYRYGGVDIVDWIVYCLKNIHPSPCHRYLPSHMPRSKDVLLLLQSSEGWSHSPRYVAARKS